MRRAAIVGVVGVCMLLFAGGSATTSASIMAGAHTYWLTGVEAVLPANAATGAKRDVSINSVSCASAGNCSAVGAYRARPNSVQGLLLTEKAGRWEPGVEVALPENADATNPFVSLGSVSCASAGNCSAIGDYADSSGNYQGLLLTETAGRWATGAEAVLPANAAKTNQDAFVSSVSCPSVGNCGAVGSYFDSSDSQWLLLSETAGHWTSGVEAPLPANAGTDQGGAGPFSVSCPSAGSCSAVGDYVDSSGNFQGLLLTETAGVWAKGVEAAPPRTSAATNQFAYLESVSCASAGNCSALGGYQDGSDNRQGQLVTETGGSWATGVEVRLPANAAKKNPVDSPGSISCASARNCSAAGSYFDRSGSDHSFLLTETAGRWATGREAALPGNAATRQPQLLLNSISCSSAGNCIAAGSYSGREHNTLGLLLTETGGSWAAGVEAALPANAAATNQDAPVVSVSCPPAGECSAVGEYLDGSGGVQGLLLDSSAKPPCVVPKLGGKTLPAAKRSIKSHDCSVGRIKHARSRRIKKGHVISQKPKPGVRLKHRAKVDLVVSKGPKTAP